MSFPVLNRKESFEIYKIHTLPLSMHNQSVSDNRKINMVAKYNLESEALMINSDWTRYALLTNNEFSICNNKFMSFCNPKRAIYQINLSKACVIALFLKHKENSKQYCRSTVYFDTVLPIA